jgi:GDP/UDP-N,N'-diacetylbacillosamine 2-epimerase (hydrolysing)
MSTTRRKICVVTGTRAEYGLLRWVMQGIQDSEVLDLQLIVTGMHLSPEFGLTVQEIQADGFRIDRKVEMLLSSDTPVGITKSMGLGIIGFADALAELQPDLLMVLGDRFETFAAASAALIARIPIAHCHGGELTEGAFDDALRHSITKMACFHFVAAEEYRRRVMQLGECGSRVFITGGLGVESISCLELYDKSTLEKILGIAMKERNLLVTFHPVTLEEGTSSQQMSELLYALHGESDVCIVFTMPNADTEGRALVNQINEFCLSHSNAYAFTSLGQRLYLSCVKHFDGVVGNSSSGFTEAPTFKKGVINIGDRQKGRLKATNIINCHPTQDSIREAIKTLYSPSFQLSLASVINPYGKPGSSKKMLDILENICLPKSQNKAFCDIKWPQSSH